MKKYLFTILLFIGLLLGANVSHAAITVDATSTAQTASAGLTFSHTTAGSNRLLLVKTSGNDVTGVTYGGVAMTKIINFFGGMDTAIWSLANPALGANNIVITKTFGNTVGVGISFNGVSQSSSIDATTTLSIGNTTNISTSIVTHSANEMLVDFVVAPTGYTETPDVAQTSRVAYSDTVQNYRHYSSTKPAATAGTYSMTWTQSGSTAAQTSLAIVSLNNYVAPPRKLKGMGLSR